MSILVVGSVALDSLETPFGKEDRILGGSGTHFGVSASYFSHVDLVAVVGSDFPAEHIDFLKSKNIGLDGLETQEGKTFHWKGKYEFDLNTAITLDTQLGVFESFSPKIPEKLAEPDVLFLANIVPALQLQVLESLPKRPWLVGLDTMNFWIESAYDDLKKVIQKVDLLVINEGEAREFTEKSNLVDAAREITALGVKYLIIKRGEYGALLFFEDHIFSAPGLPLTSIKDPTGAGDSFAGGLIGYIDRKKDINLNILKEAMICGSAMASFNVEDFSCRRTGSLSAQEIATRLEQFHQLASFELPEI